LTIKLLNHDIEQLKSVDNFVQYIDENFSKIEILFKSKTLKELKLEKFNLEDLLYIVEYNKLISKNNSPIINKFLELLFNCFEILQFKSSIKILSSYLSLTDTIYQIKANILFLNINNIKVDYHNRFDDILSLLDKSKLHQSSQKTLLLYFLISMKNFTRIRDKDIANNFKSLFTRKQYNILEQHHSQKNLAKVKL
jgi:hypothetical protein